MSDTTTPYKPGDRVWVTNTTHRGNHGIPPHEFLKPMVVRDTYTDRQTGEPYYFMTSGVFVEHDMVTGYAE